MEVKLAIKTLTPLWTGGVETGKMDRIHETNIIGSLRWWYEAIVRGLGGDVCNPTSDQQGERCPHDGDNYCQVCQIFGATGQGRKFRLRVGNGQALFSDNARNIPIPSGRIHSMKPRPRAGGWYLMSNSVIGDNIPLRFISLATPVISLATPDVSSVLHPVLALIHRHAAIGAKVSNGYGVVHLSENEQPIQAHTLGSLAARLQPSRRHALPDIRDFFFAKFQFQTPRGNSSWWQSIQGISQSWNGQVTDGQETVCVHRKQDRHQAQRNLQAAVKNRFLPLAPAVRNWLRYQWQSGLNDCQKYYLFGEARSVCPYCCHTDFKEDKKDNRRNWCFKCKRGFAKEDELPSSASKINVSHGYRLNNSDWEFRGWGWIPRQSLKNFSLNRDQFLINLKATLTDPGAWKWIFNSKSPSPNLMEWHSLSCHQQDGIAYLRELLGLSEGGAT